MGSWLRLAITLLAILAACSPALNWRVARPEGSAVTMLFPCRGEHRERSIHLAGTTVRMQMHSCSAAGATFSLGTVDAPNAAAVAPLLAALRQAAVANLVGTATARPLEVPGMTPNAASGFVRIDGRLPDGRRVVEEAAFFVDGLRLYQATMLSGSPDAEAGQTFFGSIKVLAGDEQSQP